MADLVAWGTACCLAAPLAVAVLRMNRYRAHRDRLAAILRADLDFEERCYGDDVYPAQLGVDRKAVLEALAEIDGRSLRPRGFAYRAPVATGTAEGEGGGDD